MVGGAKLVDVTLHHDEAGWWLTGTGAEAEKVDMASAYVRLRKAGQELGTKTEHLKLAAKNKYPPERILMIGDAPGDLNAARANGALFYPITARPCCDGDSRVRSYQPPFRPDPLCACRCCHFRTQIAAQSTPSGAAAASQPITRLAPTRTLAPLVVSARKRDERWVDVPMGLSVHSGERIETLGMQNVTDVLRLTPGDPAILIAGDQATTAQIASIRTQLGLDLPLTDQLLAWVGQLAQGNLGRSVFSDMEVTRLIGMRIEPTAMLAIVATLSAREWAAIAIALAGLGLVYAVLAARRR